MSDTTTKVFIPAVKNTAMSTREKYALLLKAVRSFCRKHPNHPASLELKEFLRKKER